MKSRYALKLVALLIGTLLLSQIFPSWAQAPAAPKILPEILEFDRKLCPVCKQAEIIIREVQLEYPGQFAVRKMYIDEHPATFHRYGVAIVPTQVFLDTAGKEVFRHEGVLPKDRLIRKLKEHKFIPNRAQ